MEELTFNDRSISPSMIKSILTLRYNNDLQPLLPSKKWLDFKNDSTNFNSKNIEDLITSCIKNSLPENPNHISIALSGGIDSTLILTLLRKAFPDIIISAFSIKFSNSIDESETAKQIAKNFSAEHHTIQIENYLSELPKAISIIQMPFWDIHWYYLVKTSSKFSSILFSGDGGDELFCGYTFRYKKFLENTSPNSSIDEKIKAYLDCHERDHIPEHEKIFGEKCSFNWSEIYKILEPYFDNPLPPISQVFLADYNGKLLKNFSPVNKKINDFFNIKYITPLLDEKLISQSTHMSNEYKFNQLKNIGKLPLRKILKRYNVDKFISKEKQGFSVNTINLWSNFGKKICKTYLTESRISQDGWISDDWIKNYIDSPNLDVRYINKFFGLLSFEIWYRLFITRELKSSTLLC